MAPPAAPRRRRRGPARSGAAAAAAALALAAWLSGAAAFTCQHSSDGLYSACYGGRTQQECCDTFAADLAANCFCDQQFISDLPLMWSDYYEFTCGVQVPVLPAPGDPVCTALGMRLLRRRFRGRRRRRR
eukprot:SM000122S25796  [mRNA]  locus=s122:337508:338240:+ [translate_table: standard]